MKFVHCADVHLGGWRQPELDLLNSEHFKKVIETTLKEKADFLLIAGDLFDSPYPSIDTLKNVFRELRKLADARIPVFIIPGSHDYSVSGKTFLDVLEKAGFCTNVAKYENRNDEIILQPTLYKNVALYGYPGKKSGLEVDEIQKAKIEDAPGFFKILMLHTTLRSAVPNPIIKAVEDTKLPKVHYMALGHLHIQYSKNGKVYSGPTFPNNVLELEELKGGSFYVFNEGNIERREIRIKEVVVIAHETKSTLHLTEEIINKFEMRSLKDKIIILKLSGILEQGTLADIDFRKIEEYARSKGCWCILKSTNKLLLPEPFFKMESIDTEDLESQIIKRFQDLHQSKFNNFIIPLMRALQMEKIYDEKSAVFEERFMSEAKKIIVL